MNPLSSLNCCLSRRHFLGSGAMGVGGFGLATLLGRDGLLASEKRLR